MTRDVAAELTQALEWARTVNEVLPIDEDAERIASALLARHHARRPGRKLRSKP